MLDPDDQPRLTTAEGLADLGMFLDALAELDEIALESCHRPEVLAARLPIYAELNKWELMQTVAQKLVSEEPENVHWIVSLAYATRRTESIAAAKTMLLDAVERHPAAAILHYNLSCDECQLGQIELAKERLYGALKLDTNFRRLAFDDEDLEPLWNSLGPISSGET
jgi:predicted Zn-dependent protease